MIGFKDLKEIGSTLQSIGKIDDYNKIIELQSQLLDMQNTIQELTKENNKLKDKLNTKEKLVHKNNAYYIGTDGPYCTRCWDKNKDLIRIIPNWIGGNIASCPECKNCVNYTGREDNYNITEQNNSDLW